MESVVPEIISWIIERVREIEEKNNINQRYRTVMRNLRDWQNPFEVSEAHFIKNFRMPQVIATKLIEILRPHDPQPYSTIPFHIKVLAAVNFFATGSHQTPVGRSNILNLSQPAMSRIIADVRYLIIRHLHGVIKFPTTANDVDAKAEEFRRAFGIYNTIGCIDCTHIAIVTPPCTDPLRPARLYRNRKRHYSLNVEAVCDANLKFLSVNARFPGATHDSGIWAMSKVRKRMQDLSNQHDVWLFGDSGYPLEPWLLTPYSHPQESWQYAFNNSHIKCRNVIERSFGVLKATYRCLLKERTLHYQPTQAAEIVNACFILYNFFHQEGCLQTDIEIHEEEVPVDLAIIEQADIYQRGLRVRETYALASFQ